MTARRPRHRKGGRPPKSLNDAYSEHLGLRLRPFELAAIQHKAAEAGLDPSVYVRMQALGLPVIKQVFNTLAPIDRHDIAQIGAKLEEISGELNHQGININQAQMRFNESGNPERGQVIIDIMRGYILPIITDDLEPALAQLRAILERCP